MNDMKPRIAVVDDDLRLRDLRTRYLSEQGYRIARVHGAHLRLLARAGGGLEARVELPLSPAA